MTILWILISVCVFCSILFIVGGWHWQSSKTPEQRHLEYLIDVGDPYAVEFAEKIQREARLRQTSEQNTANETTS